MFQMEEIWNCRFCGKAVWRKLYLIHDEFCEEKDYMGRKNFSEPSKDGRRYKQGNWCKKRESVKEALDASLVENYKFHGSMDELDDCLILDTNFEELSEY